MGHPDILRKFNHSLKQDELEKKSKIEKVTEIVGEEFTFDFIELAPEIFSIIRQIQNVEESLVK